MRLFQSSFRTAILLIFSASLFSFAQDNVLSNRCSIVSTVDDCVELKDLQAAFLKVPENVTRIEPGFLSICGTEVYSGDVIDILYIMDNSGSMYSRTGRNGMDPNGIRFEALNEALLYQANKFNGKSNAAVIQFNRYPDAVGNYGREPIEVLKNFEAIGPQNLKDFTDLNALTDVNEAGGTPYIATLDTVKNVLIRNNYDPTGETGRKTLIFFITDGGPTDYNLSSENTPANRDRIRAEIGDLLNGYDFPEIHMFFISPEDPTTLNTTEIEILNNDVIEMLIGANPDVNQEEGSHKHIDSGSDDEISGIADFIAQIIDEATKSTEVASATLENITANAEAKSTGVDDNDKIQFDRALPIEEGSNEFLLDLANSVVVNGQQGNNENNTLTFWVETSEDSIVSVGEDSDDFFIYECGSTSLRVYRENGDIIPVGDSLTYKDNQIQAGIEVDAFKEAVAKIEFDVKNTKDLDRIDANPTNADGVYETALIDIRVDNIDGDDGIIYTRDIDKITVTWEHPHDPRDKVSQEVKVFFELEPQFSIYDINGDGIPDQITISSLEDWANLKGGIESITYQWVDSIDAETINLPATLTNEIEYTIADGKLPFGVTSGDFRYGNGEIVIEVADDDPITFPLIDKVGPVLIKAWYDGPNSNDELTTINLTFSEKVEISDTYEIMRRQRLDTASMQSVDNLIWQDPIIVDVSTASPSGVEITIETSNRRGLNIGLEDRVNLLPNESFYVQDENGNIPHEDNPYVIVYGDPSEPMGIVIGPDESVVVFELLGTNVDGPGKNDLSVEASVWDNPQSDTPSGYKEIDIYDSKDALLEGKPRESENISTDKAIAIKFDINILPLEQSDGGTFSLQEWSNYLSAEMSLYDQAGQFINKFTLHTTLAPENVNAENLVSMLVKVDLDPNLGLVNHTGRAVGSGVIIAKIDATLEQEVVSSEDLIEGFKRTVKIQEFVNFGYRVVK